MPSQPSNHGQPSQQNEKRERWAAVLKEASLLVNIKCTCCGVILPRKEFNDLQAAMVIKGKLPRCLSCQNCCRSIVLTTGKKSNRHIQYQYPCGLWSCRTSQQCILGYCDKQFRTYRNNIHTGIYCPEHRCTSKQCNRSRVIGCDLCRNHKCSVKGCARHVANDAEEKHLYVCHEHKCKHCNAPVIPGGISCHSHQCSADLKCEGELGVCPVHVCADKYCGGLKEENTDYCKWHMCIKGCRGCCMIGGPHFLMKCAVTECREQREDRSSNCTHHTCREPNCFRSFNCDHMCGHVDCFNLTETAMFDGPERSQLVGEHLPVSGVIGVVLSYVATSDNECYQHATGNHECAGDTIGKRRWLTCGVVGCDHYCSQSAVKNDTNGCLVGKCECHHRQHIRDIKGTPYSKQYYKVLQKHQ